MSEQTSVPADGGQGADGATAANGAITTDQNTSPPAPFYSIFKNPELRGYMEKKQFADPETLADSYRNLEKYQGVPQERLLKLPESLEDAEAMKPIYEKLGFLPPASPDDYKFGDMEGADPEFSKTAAGWMHEIGIPERYAKPLAEKWNAFANAQSEAVLTQASEEAAVEFGALQAEWGGKYDEYVEAGRRAARQFGFTQENLEAIEQTVGGADLMRKFKAMGERLAESSFVEGDTKPKGFQSPDAAKSEIANLISDGEFSKRLRAGDKEAKARWDRLHQMAYPGS